jgi:predicted acetyltransferase
VGVEIRPATEDELAEQQSVVAYVFASPSMTGPDAPARLRPEWSMCAFVDGRMATSAGAWPLRVRLNGRSVAMAGVTMVGTLPEHRRTGLVRQVMARILSDARDAGQTIAILWASMGAIYQRYGYGLASTGVTYDLDPREIVFAAGEAATGRVRLMPRDEAQPINEALYKEFNRPRNLLIQRAPGMWHAHYQVEGDNPLHFGVYYDAAGEPRGYVVYALDHNTGVSGRDQRIVVNDWAAMDTDAYRGIWEFFASHDLVGRIVWDGVAEDDPAPLLFLEPRRLGRRTFDAIWMRITDVEGALRQRPYGDADALTIGVHDALCPWNDGTYVLETTGAAAEVTKVDAEPDLTMPIASLAILLSGHRSATALARAGLLDAPEPKSLIKADRLFATDYAPWCNDSF